MFFSRVCAKEVLSHFRKFCRLAIIILLFLQAYIMNVILNPQGIRSERIVKVKFLAN